MAGIQYIQNGIFERQQELHRIAEILATAAQRRAKSAAASKIVTVCLGAFVATQAVAVQIVDENSPGVIAIYAFAGLLIAAVGGLEAAFKNETKAAELTVLAAQCQSTIWQIDSEWSKTVGTTHGDEQLAAAKGLLDRQDAALTEIQTRAAQAGQNVTFDVRELYGPEMPAMA